VAVVGQGGLGLLEGGEHRAVEAGKGRSGGGLGGLDAGAHAFLVGEGPVDQRTEQEAERAAGEQASDRGRGRADRPAEADARIEIGGGHADPRRLGGKPALGLANVRAARQQGAAVADRDGAVEPQHGPARARRRGESGGRAAGERGEAE
jgi:hypothetical protein